MAAILFTLFTKISIGTKRNIVFYIKFHVPICNFCGRNRAYSTEDDGRKACRKTIFGKEKIRAH